jgi:hypothetical protein
MKQFHLLRALILFGLEDRGFGRATGRGKEAVGAFRRIQVRCGFRIVILFTTEDMYSCRGDGDNTLGLEVKLKLGNEG